MNISIFGVGYVGAVCAACLARSGHHVVAVDTNAETVARLADGQSPVIEPGLDALTARAVAQGRLTATTNAAAAVRETEVSLVCVGTPSLPNGRVDLAAVAAVAREIGQALRAKAGRHAVVFRSTVVPGTMEQTVIPVLEQASTLQAGSDFGVGYYPEFLRETTALRDFDEPGTVVIGERDARTADVVARLNEGNGGQVFRVALREAEAIKYANNAWHALKVSFANEIGLISRSAGLDGRRVMEILCSDTRLNVSPAYLRPGFAFGGSCLPKDLRGLRFFARNNDVATPLLDGILAANENQIAEAFRMVEATGKRRVALLGLTFKDATDDMRESPFVELAERLVGKGYNLRIYDPSVTHSHLIGANRHFILGRIPHLFGLLDDDLASVVRAAEVVIVGRSPRDRGGSYLATLLRPDQAVIDLEGRDPALRADGYAGICW